MPEVRSMTAADQAGVVALFQEMQAHYGVPCPPADRIAQGLADLPAGVAVLVAREEERTAGFAAVATLYPGPGLEPGLFLKELFVSREARGRGLGRALLRAVAALARAAGAKRVDWTADGGDARLLAFYRSTGAVVQTRKVFFRLDGEALADLAAGDP